MERFVGKSSQAFYRDECSTPNLPASQASFGNELVNFRAPYTEQGAGFSYADKQPIHNYLRDRIAQAAIEEGFVRSAPDSLVYNWKEPEETQSVFRHQLSIYLTDGGFDALLRNRVSGFVVYSLLKRRLRGEHRAV